MVLAGGAGLCARQLKRDGESLVRGDIDYDGADFDVDEEERFGEPGD